MHISAWQFWVFGISETSTDLHVGPEIALPTLGKVAML